MAKCQPNFTSDEIDVGCGRKRSKVLFGSFGTGLSSAMKDKTWEEVASSVSAVSGVRSMAEVKKKWAVMKSLVKNKPAAINRERVRTGGGPSVGLSLSASEERVVALMSNVSVTGISTGFDTADYMVSSLPSTSCK